jgi:hypothetical protein
LNLLTAENPALKLPKEVAESPMAGEQFQKADA